MRRRAYLAGAGSLGLVSIAGCTAVGDAADDLFGDDYDIGMDRNAFLPETHETRVGESVVWRNTTGSVHTVTAYQGTFQGEAEYFASGGFESETAARKAWKEDGGGAIATGDTFEHAFDVPGTYPYFCIPHETDGAGRFRMVGTLVVSE